MDMDISFLKSRHSVRAFRHDPISPDAVKALKAEMTMTNTHEAGMHFTLVFDDDNPFRGFSKSYGVFNNARNYLAVIADTSFPDAMERAGYFAQRFVMRALELGLGSCCVGGTYNPDRINLQMRVDWKLLFVVVFGYPLDRERLLARAMRGFIHRHDRKPEDFFKGTTEDLSQARAHYPWIDMMLEAVACAPSSLNKQPVRISLSKEGDPRQLTASVDDRNPKNLVDLGIAKFNAGAVAPGIWEWGNGAPFLSE
jgi:nitroreductase family protein